MIDSFIAMTGVAAEAACAFYALNGWRKALRERDVALDDAAYERWHHGQTKHTLAQTIATKIDTEDKLRRIERQRSETTRKGNLTRYAKRRAEVLAKAAELQPAPKARLAA
jgi:hypothetical protein